MATKQAPEATTEQAEAPASKQHHCACLTGTDQVCPAMTLKAFAQGHDARMSSRVAQAIADKTMTEKEGLELIAKAGGSELLVGKTKRSAALRTERAKPAAEKAPKAEKPAAGTKATAKDAKPADTAKAPPSVIGTKVRVTHKDKEYEAVVVRNASNDLVARHRVNGQNVDHPVTVGEGNKITVN